MASKAEEKKLLNKKDEENSDGSSSEEEEDEPKSCPERYEGDQFIWTVEELKEDNRRRSKKDEFDYVKRDKEFNYTSGIRAHPEMDANKCWKSMIIPWHNEFIAIWLYVAFALYFWI